MALEIWRVAIPHSLGSLARWASRGGTPPMEAACDWKRKQKPPRAAVDESQNDWAVPFPLLIVMRALAF
ncbi:hypothetical protein NL676_025721 [Syzygium grande]|nr:hypothetical protein NL676_025721 [Syzygium grande]